ncbi:hypothetical protein V5799_004534 [Amblyomma americanum]|uniref:Uncharacterized protein n=1 Tax=Amblyomma americanum TaxID=6943 RepID=A0AAQ4D5U4_AMBAM
MWTKRRRPICWKAPVCRGSPVCQAAVALKAAQRLVVGPQQSETLCIRSTLRKESGVLCSRASFKPWGR